MNDILSILRDNPYPGRGILVGCSSDGKQILTFYFIMGRSENSRNRIFEKTDDGIKTKAFDPDKLTDPTLVIYNPVRVLNNHLIITNGDQTDTIYEFLSKGSDFRSALLTRTFEPDPPNYTPRISCLVEPIGAYHLSILKTIDGSENGCLRNFFEYSNPTPGLGHFISTYNTDGDPLPSFSGEPIPVIIDNNNGLKYLADRIWESLNMENKVSLYARETDISTGMSNDIIINKHTY